jgi:hypothetical protein
MSTTTKAARPIKPSTFTITFTIGADDYHVVPLRPHPEVAAKAFRFRKQGGDRAVYDVRVAEHGPECDCPGFTHWHPKRGTLCKHVRTLKAAGMIA